MPLKTTVIGSYAQPEWLNLKTWFVAGHAAYDCSNFKPATGNVLEEQLDRAVKEVIDEQVTIGIDVITNGEVGRENYVYDFCRYIHGFDFQSLELKTYRNGACQTMAPVVRNKLEIDDENEGIIKHVVSDWKKAQSFTKNRVKYTLPGPETIIDTTLNEYYEEIDNLRDALVSCINRTIQALVKSGCKHIQIDEPVLVRKPQSLASKIVRNANLCVEDLPNDVTKTIHLCCGYPRFLDDKDYLKADKERYQDVAELLDNSIFDEVSIEDAHRRNDLSLFKKFTRKRIILGTIKIAESEIETQSSIEDRIKEVLTAVPKNRLIIAPDCGLGFLPKEILIKKLTNMVQAAKNIE